MDAKEYLKKSIEICAYYDERGLCVECPLKLVGCGTPNTKEEIDEALSIVDAWKMPHKTKDELILDMIDAAERGDCAEVSSLSKAYKALTEGGKE